ncbi:MAG TPA: DNA polymerase/3'-5' exonuclease PolX [Phycisphaerales bacterium]|nr:DNA polymerase/3'-5' exonuclease PolX [Phycisphaerales bacterium]
MPIPNHDVAAIFSKVADLLEIKGENPFRVRAYREAARTVSGLSQSVADLLKEGRDLTELPGIGKDLAGKIEEIVTTGRLTLLEDLTQQIPGELTELMKVAGLGAKRVARMYQELNIRSLDDLRQAAEQGRLAELEGFGDKTQTKILEEVKRLRRDQTHRTLLAIAAQYAQPLMDHLGKAKGVKDLIIAGSYRRRRETVHDLDILATCKRGSTVMDHFVKYDEVKEVVSHGKTRSTVLLRSGFQVDLRVVPQVSYGAALVYFTGSKPHNIAIRKRAVRKKLKINEYGVFRGNGRIAGRTEEEVYDTLGLPWIPPDLRENRGEVEAAEQGTLPTLVELGDIQGDLHVHTNYTDGRHTIEQMARAAQKRGYKYLAIADHSQRITVAHGLMPKALREQIEQIDRLNDRLKGFVVLKAIEVDILADGRLDLPDEVLKELDLRVCSIHSKFNLSRTEQTERVLRAMDNPYFNILAHPTGRLIGERDAYDLDMERIMEHAAANGCYLELNAHPERLDLDDNHCRMAKNKGLKVVVSTDAHRMDDLAYMVYGVGQARRGWLEADDVLNSRNLKDLRTLLRR